jgi:vancomycin resistance protein YoaR
MEGRPEERPPDAVVSEDGAPSPRRRWSWWFWGALVVFAGIVAAFGWVQASHAGRVAGGVSTAGVSLGGLTEKAARARLSEEIARRGIMTVVLRTPDGQTIVLPLERLGISFDVPATVSGALRHGRIRVAGLSVYTGGGGAVAPILKVDPAIYLAGLVVVSDKVDRAAQDASLRLQGGRAVVHPAVDGLAVDDVALERAILAAVGAGRRFEGSVPVTSVSAAVSTADVEARAGAAALYLRRPLVLRYRERAVRLAPATLATLLSVNRGADADSNPLTFANPAAEAFLHRAFAVAERPAVDARVEVHGNQVVITPSRDGIQIDMPRLVSEMDQAAALSGGLRAVFVQVTIVTPRYTDAALRQMGLSALGSEFTTYFDAGNQTRAANIALCAKLVDGAIVAPGKVFSLNDRVGPRTLNRGFDYAPVIVDGVLRQGVGGGVCQFATTLFNAVFFAGLPVVERHPHQFAIEHYPLGRDAAVSWGAADFKFKNDTAQPLMVRCWAGGGSLTVVIVGSTGRSVTYQTSAMTDVHKPAHARTDPRVVLDANVSHGVTMMEQGAPGYGITVRRTVKLGGAVLFTDSFSSTYAPRDWIKRVGTGTS